MTPSAVLALQGVTKHYDPRQPPAVDRVSLTLHQGEILALLGPSGCGKTTLLRLIAGFERPQTGTITLAGQSVCGPDWLPPERRDVGIVFQDYALFPHLTVLQNVAFGLGAGDKPRRRRRPAADQPAAAMAVLDLVGLADLARRFPHELSGGQQQRVALARALAPRPTLVLLDEPFSNLDVQVRLYLRQEVRGILKRVGASGVFVTHDQEEALAIADRVAVMQAGRIEQEGPPETIYGAPASRFVAAFVTQANFVAARRGPQGWATELGCFDLPPIAEDPDQAELMVRQEELQLEAAPDGPLRIQDRQFLGREYEYRLVSAAGTVFRARLPLAHRFEVGVTVRPVVAEAGLRLFPVAAPDCPAAPLPV